MRRIAQMAEATEEVKTMLGGAKVSIKEIQDALWYYYFDVNQTAAYLVGECLLLFWNPTLEWGREMSSFVHFALLNGYLSLMGPLDR